MNKKQEILKQKISEAQHIYIDCDGSLFDNVSVMIEAKCHTFKEFFGVDPLASQRGQVLENLNHFYKNNPDMFKRKNFWVMRSLRTIEECIQKEGADSFITEKEIFHMSSKALGAAFIPFSEQTLPGLHEKFMTFFSHTSEEIKKQHHYLKAKENIEAELREQKERKGALSSVSNQTYIKNDITSQLAFDVYFAVYHAFFVQKIKPFPYSREIVQKLNGYAEKSGKKFGMISNRNRNSLFTLLETKNFLGESMLRRGSVIAGDPVLGGKPEIHQFRSVVPKGEKLIYMGDSLIDVEAVKKINQEDAEDTAFITVIPSEYEYSDTDDGRLLNKKSSFGVVLAHAEILEVLEKIY